MSLPPEMRQTLSMSKGETKIWDFALTLQGEPIDASGASAWFTVKRSLSDADPLLQKTESDGITLGLEDGSKGVVRLEASDTDSLENARVTLSFRLEILLDGDTYVVAAGSILIYPFTTR